jgi:hypothetical protein
MHLLPEGLNPLTWMFKWLIRLLCDVNIEVTIICNNSIKYFKSFISFEYESIILNVTIPHYKTIEE